MTTTATTTTTTTTTTPPTTTTTGSGGEVRVGAEGGGEGGANMCHRLIVKLRPNACFDSIYATMAVNITAFSYRYQSRNGYYIYGQNGSSVAIYSSLTADSPGAKCGRGATRDSVALPLAMDDGNYCSKSFGGFQYVLGDAIDLAPNPPHSQNNSRRFALGASNIYLID